MVEESQRSPTAAVSGGYSLVHCAICPDGGEGQKSLEMSVDSSFVKGMDRSGLERRIVVEDDEELPSHVGGDDRYTITDESTFSYNSSLPRDKLFSSKDDKEGQELDAGDISILPATPISSAAAALPPSSTSISTLVPSLLSGGVVPPSLSQLSLTTLAT
ncbi:hypothetical protein BKA70DRAFT_1424226 [Coprinopsis sp. MPI-PUGE-AT-0042]|nr:hypothetical protein BKA70DRAFT_1424226 [Coprinopsis sp. MPI-PUGE-AT-0042]